MQIGSDVMMSFHESIICQWRLHWFFSWVGTWWLVLSFSWKWYQCEMEECLKNDWWRNIQRDWQLIITRRWMRVSSEEMKVIASKRWNDIFSESWWLCSSEWIDDANESLILANVGFGRCSNGLTVDLCRSAERELHQKRWKWWHQEYVNWWNKAGWWFMAESWK